MTTTRARIRNRVTNYVVTHNLIGSLTVLKIYVNV